mmetsp:Transcript_70828/g.114169  ORF Transcript_70828/g.114169 Transcript_70828/m.114169 type:complete len:261 (-) Transcript_70828:321-1103(-)
MLSFFPSLCKSKQQVRNDEKYARELQQRELQMTQGAESRGQGNTVVQGHVVNSSVAPPVGDVYGINQGYGGGPQSGFGGGPQPGVIGVHQQMDGLPYAMSNEPSPAELIVFQYRTSLKCFAGIDILSTFLNGLSAVATTSGAVNSKMGSATGDQDTGFVTALSLFSLLLVLGPICGFIGASKLNRSLIAVYLVFCFFKLAMEILLAVVSPYLWYLLIALIQVWVTRIVFIFWKVLGSLSDLQLEQLRNPNYVPDVRPMYW